jgi:hypothetical protein
MTTSKHDFGRSSNADAFVCRKCLCILERNSPAIQALIEAGHKPPFEPELLNTDAFGCSGDRIT